MADSSHIRPRRAHTSFIMSSNNQSNNSLINNDDPIYHNPHFNPSLTQDGKQSRTSLDHMENRTREWREQYMQMSVDEVSEWLQRVAGNVKLVSFVSSAGRRESLLVEREEQSKRAEAVRLDDESIAPPILFDALQTGVLLCELAMEIEPGLAIKYKKNAAPGTFLARDNIENFIKAAIKWGVPRSQIFEVDDLVMRKNDRAVINSLLDITRVVYLKFKIEPPQLIKYEFEIAEIEAHAQPERVAAQPEPIIEPELPEQIPVCESPPPEPEPEPQPEPEPDCEPEPEPEPEPVEPPKPKGPRFLPYFADETDPLDVAVGNMVNKYALDLLMKRVAKGQYYIGEQKVHHLRLVRHLVLVRVGGGWEPLVPMASRKIQEQFL